MSAPDRFETFWIKARLGNVWHIGDPVSGATACHKQFPIVSEWGATYPNRRPEPVISRRCLACERVAALGYVRRPGAGVVPS